MDTKSLKAPVTRKLECGTTIRCDKYHSGANIKKITSTLFTCVTIHPNYRQSHQGHKKIVPEDVARPQQKTNQEAS